MMSRLLFFLLFSCIQFHLSAQSFEWVRSGSGIGQDVGEKVATDLEGNLYVTGYFAGEALFSGQLLQGNGIFDVFLAKYNPQGDLLWIRNAGGPQNDAGYGVDTDSKGNVYITGYFNQSATFGEPGNFFSLNSNGNNDIFIAKYSSEGSLIWVKKAGGQGEDRGFNLKVDVLNNIYITGHFSSRAFFGSQIIDSRGSTDVFIAKYDSSGNCHWVQGLGGFGLDKSFGLAVDSSSSAYITGFFYYDAQLTNSSTVLNADGLSSDIFVAKYSSTGNNVWAHRIGGPFNDAAYALTLDKDKSIYITGYFLDEAYFGDFYVRAKGYNDVFVAKYDSTFKCEWALSEGGNLLDIGFDIGIDNAGFVYVTGMFDSIAHFGNERVVSADDYDIFLCKYSPKGILIWVERAGGNFGDFPRGMQVEGNGTIYLTGYYKQSATFGNIQADWGRENDIFITKFSQPTVSVQPIPETSQFSVFPNPSTGLFFISLENTTQPGNLLIHDAQGRLLMHKDVAQFENKLTLNLHHLKPGIYFLTYQTSLTSSTNRVVLFGNQ